MRTAHYTEFGAMLPPLCADAGGFVTYDPEAARLIAQQLVSGEGEFSMDATESDRWVGRRIAYIEDWRGDGS